MSFDFSHSNIVPDTNIEVSGGLYAAVIINDYLEKLYQFFDIEKKCPIYQGEPIFDKEFGLFDYDSKNNSIIISPLLLFRIKSEQQLYKQVLNYIFHHELIEKYNFGINIISYDNSNPSNKITNYEYTLRYSLDIDENGNLNLDEFKNLFDILNHRKYISDFQNKYVCILYPNTTLHSSISMNNLKQFTIELAKLCAKNPYIAKHTMVSSEFKDLYTMALSSQNILDINNKKLKNKNNCKELALVNDKPVITHSSLKEYSDSLAAYLSLILQTIKK